MAVGREERILVAGGGVGGLAAALGLAQKGFAVTVLEKAARLGEIGAGIQLGPNAFAPQHANQTRIMRHVRVQREHTLTAAERDRFAIRRAVTGPGLALQPNSVALCHVDGAVVRPGRLHDGDAQARVEQSGG